MAAVFTPIGTVLCLLPFPRVSRASLRVACASAGAFGMVLTIALMARVPAWGDVWERFWVQNGSDWATSKEKGLSAAYCLLLITGILSDWLLHHRVGENPDEVRYHVILHLNRRQTCIFYRNGTATWPITPPTFQMTATARVHLLLSFLSGTRCLATITLSRLSCPILHSRMILI